MDKNVVEVYYYNPNVTTAEEVMKIEKKSFEEAVMNRWELFEPLTMMLPMMVREGFLLMSSHNLFLSKN